MKTYKIFGKEIQVSFYPILGEVLSTPHFTGIAEPNKSHLYFNFTFYELYISINNFNYEAIK